MRRLSWIAFSLAALVCAAPVMAHHSFAMFDMTKDVTYIGSVVAYKWANPHVHVTVRVPAGPGVDPATVGVWDMEAAGGTTIMSRQGWNKATLKAGDPIHAVAHPLRNGDKGASLFYMLKSDGTRMYTDIARPKAE